MHATIVTALLISMCTYLVSCEVKTVGSNLFDENVVLNNMLSLIQENLNAYAKDNMTLPDVGTYVTKLRLNGIPEISFSCPTKLAEVNGQQEVKTCVRVENVGVSGDLKPTSFMPQKPVNITVKPFEFLLKLALFPKEGSKSTQNLKEDMLTETPVKGVQILGLDTMLYKEWGGFDISGPGYGTIMNFTAKLPILKTEIMHIIMRQVRPLLRTFLYTKARMSFF